MGLVQIKLAEKRRKKIPIFFADADLPRGEIHSNSLVITMDMEGIDVKRVLVNIGSNVNILYKEVFEKLGINLVKMRSNRTQLSGFTGNNIKAGGKVELNVEIETSPNVLRTNMEFMVVNIPYVHNVILRTMGITKARAIISMTHLYMKFYTPDGIGIVRDNKKFT